MDSGYRSEVYEQLEKRFYAAALHRPMRIGRYEPGTELTYEMEAVTGKGRAQVCIIIEAFVGGGFAGQVYRVKVLDIKSEGGGTLDLEVGSIYAMKILIPFKFIKVFYSESVIYFIFWLKR